MQKGFSSGFWLIARSNLLIWQCTPLKPGWHLQMYSLKTSPRLVGAMTSQDPSFSQGLGLQGPEDGKRKVLISVRASVLSHQNFPFQLYLSLSGYSCLHQSHQHRCRWRVPLLLQSRMLLHCSSDLPYSSQLSERDKGKAVQRLLVFTIHTAAAHACIHCKKHTFL